MTFCNISVIIEDICLKLRVCVHYPKSNPYYQGWQFKMFFSPLPAKPKGTLDLHSFRLSVNPSVRPSVCQSAVLVFRTFFPKRLQILTCFLACKSITMTFRTSLSFVTVHLFLAKLRALDIVNFSDQTVFWTFFLNACRYWPDFWYVSQSPWLSERVWVLLRSIYFWQNYGLWT